MKTIKKNFYLLIKIAIIFSIPNSASAWIFGTSKVKDGPPKEYCVSPGWFNSNPYKCVPYDQAEKLDKDYSSVYSAASSRSSDMYTLAQNDIDQGKSNLKKLEESLASWKRKLSDTTERINSGERFTPGELEGFRAQEKAFSEEVRKMDLQVKAAKSSLSEKEAGTSGQQLSAGSQRLEIARKGLLTQVSDLENKLGSLEDNLRNTEQELNNTVLEAFVVSKINRLAESFCEAKNMCEKNPGEVKKWLTDKVASEKLRSSFKGTTPLAPAVAPAAAAGAPASK